MALNKVWALRNIIPFAEQTSICTLFPIPIPHRVRTTEVLGGPVLLRTRIPLLLGLVTKHARLTCTLGDRQIIMALKRIWIIRIKAFAEQTSICTLWYPRCPGRGLTTEERGEPRVLGTQIPLDACPSLCPE